MSTVDSIKDRWPLASMLARLNITVPTRGKFHSPFRADNTPSCAQMIEEGFDARRKRVEAQAKRKGNPHV